MPLRIQQLSAAEFQPTLRDSQMTLTAPAAASLVDAFFCSILALRTYFLFLATLDQHVFDQSDQDGKKALIKGRTSGKTRALTVECLQSRAAVVRWGKNFYRTGKKRPY